ncbi:MAG: hypothetical protein ACE5HX_12905 [bacterium]
MSQKENAAENRIKIYDIKDFDIKSIADRAMLVRLVRKKLFNNKLDETISRALVEKYKIRESGIIRAKKSLFPKDCTEEINRSFNSANIFFYNNTLPWTDSGFRLLLVKNYEHFVSNMRQHKEKVEKAVQDFIKNYDTHLRRAKKSLNLAFNPEDYPEKKALKDMFELTVKFTRIPDTDDVRLNLPKEEIEEIKATIIANAKKELAESKSDETLDVIKKIM